MFKASIISSKPDISNLEAANMNSICSAVFTLHKQKADHGCCKQHHGLWTILGKIDKAMAICEIALNIPACPDAPDV